MIQSLDHIQLALPVGAEKKMRAFYCDLLGMIEITKPASLQRRGGFWAMAGTLQVHFGIDPNFTPATKAHPAFIVSDLDALARLLHDAGAPVKWDMALSDIKRLFTLDPVGNRIELMSA